MYLIPAPPRFLMEGDGVLSAHQAEHMACWLEEWSDHTVQ